MIGLCLVAALLWQDPDQIGAELAAGRAAVQAHPATADAHFMLGKSLAMHLHHPAAIPELREALRLGLPPLGAAEAHRWLGYTLMHDGQTSAAQDAFHALAAMAGAPPAWRTEAEGLAGQMEASRNALRAVSAAERRATWVLSGLALAVLAAFGGGIAQARRAARSAA